MGELQAGKSPFKTRNTYDENLKIWSGGEKRSLFSPDWSIGEIIFQQMERNAMLTAQVLKKFTRNNNYIYRNKTFRFQLQKTLSWPGKIFIQTRWRWQVICVNWAWNKETLWESLAGWPLTWLLWPMPVSLMELLIMPYTPNTNNLPSRDCSEYQATLNLLWWRWVWESSSSHQRPSGTNSNHA